MITNNDTNLHGKLQNQKNSGDAMQNNLEIEKSTGKRAPVARAIVRTLLDSTIETAIPGIEKIVDTVNNVNIGANYTQQAMEQIDKNLANMEVQLQKISDTQLGQELLDGVQDARGLTYGVLGVASGAGTVTNAMLNANSNTRTMLVDLFVEPTLQLTDSIIDRNAEIILAGRNKLGTTFKTIGEQFSSTGAKLDTRLNKIEVKLEEIASSQFGLEMLDSVRDARVFTKSISLLGEGCTFLSNAIILKNNTSMPELWPSSKETISKSENNIIPENKHNIFPTRETHKQFDKYYAETKKYEELQLPNQPNTSSNSKFKFSIEEVQQRPRPLSKIERTIRNLSWEKQFREEAKYLTEYESLDLLKKRYESLLLKSIAIPSTLGQDIPEKYEKISMFITEQICAYRSRSIIVSSGELAKRRESKNKLIKECNDIIDQIDEMTRAQKAYDLIVTDIKNIQSEFISLQKCRIRGNNALQELNQKFDFNNPDKMLIGNCQLFIAELNIKISAIKNNATICKQKADGCRRGGVAELPDMRTYSASALNAIQILEQFVKKFDPKSIQNKPIIFDKDNEDLDKLRNKIIGLFDQCLQPNEKEHDLEYKIFTHSLKNIIFMQEYKLFMSNIKTYINPISDNIKIFKQRADGCRRSGVAELPDMRTHSVNALNNIDTLSKFINDMIANTKSLMTTVQPTELEYLTFLHFTLEERINLHQKNTDIDIIDSKKLLDANKTLLIANESLLKTLGQTTKKIIVDKVELITNEKVKKVESNIKIIDFLGAAEKQAKEYTQKQDTEQKTYEIEKKPEVITTSFTSKRRLNLTGNNSDLVNQTSNEADTNTLLETNNSNFFNMLTCGFLNCNKKNPSKEKTADKFMKKKL